MNYTALGRTNYFKVKDVVAFKEWAQNMNMRVSELPGIDGQTRYCLLADSDDGFPSYTVDDNDNDMDIDIAQEISKHLQPGEIAVLMEIGNEGLRYLRGYAQAVDAAGKSCTVDLGDIYHKAAQFFGVPCADITEAQY